LREPSDKMSGRGKSWTAKEQLYALGHVPSHRGGGEPLKKITSGRKTGYLGQLKA